MKRISTEQRSTTSVCLKRPLVIFQFYLYHPFLQLCQWAQKTFKTAQDEYEMGWRSNCPGMRLGRWPLSSLSTPADRRGLIYGHKYPQRLLEICRRGTLPLSYIWKVRNLRITLFQGVKWIIYYFTFRLMELYYRYVLFNPWNRQRVPGLWLILLWCLMLSLMPIYRQRTLRNEEAQPWFHSADQKLCSGFM